MKETFTKAAQKKSTTTENGAIAHASLGTALLDQFSKSGSHRGRNIQEVFAEQSRIDSEVGIEALRFVMYLRLVSRKCKYNDGTITETVQKGQGAKDESFKRLLWYAVNKPEVFYDNISLLPVVGSFKDIFDIIYLAEQHKIELDVDRILKEILVFTDSSLLKKYLPQLKSESKLTTDRARSRNNVAKRICQLLKITPKTYRKLKTLGEAHQWQQQISKQLYNDIEFGKISGRALTQLINSKFLKNHNLIDKYTKWLEDQPVAKFTGYPYELMSKVAYNMSVHQKMTIDKQFDGLIELAKQDQGAIFGNVWCAIDTSGSMSTPVAGGATTAINACLSLGIYFSTLNEGKFHKNIIRFDSTSRVQELNGSFTDMVQQLRSAATAWGSTNFQSVINEIVRIRNNNPKVDLKDFPQTLLVVSDMQFNPSGSKATNHETAMKKLRKVFPSEWVDQFRVIWWDCTGRVKTNQPTTMDEGGTYVFSGFDGSILTLLLGGSNVADKQDQTMEESVQDVLHQEVLMSVEY